MQDDLLLSRFVGFATLGILTSTQELSGKILESIREADPATVIEETFSLVAITSARAAEVGFSDRVDLGRGASMTLASLPLFHRDYIVGSAVLAEENVESLVDVEQLSRRMSFYAAHFPESSFPGPIALTEKMELWMGRVSVPGLSQKPAERLEELELVQSLHLHLRLVLGFARQLIAA